MRSPIILPALLTATSAAAAPVTFIAPLAPARDLPPLGQAIATFDADANTLRLRIKAAPGALDTRGPLQLQIHANYAGNLLIGDPLTAQVASIAPATTDDQDGDGEVELFESVPLIGESWWVLDSVFAAADGSLVYDQTFSTAADQLFGPDPIELGSPGVSGPEDLDFPGDVDNIGFFRSALLNFGLLGFDIHGKFDPLRTDGVGLPGEIDGDGTFEPNGPALGGAFVAAAVPTPGAMALFGFGLGGLALAYGRRRA